MDVEITFCFLLQLRLPLIDHIITLFNCHQYPDQGSFWCFLLLTSLFLLLFFSFHLQMVLWFHFLCDFWTLSMRLRDMETYHFSFCNLFLEWWGQCWHCIIPVWALSKFSPWSLAESHYPAEWLWHMREERGQWSGLAVCCACQGPVSYLLWDFGQII